ncbi:MAG: transporter substrate-binding domain-containing protein [Reinekea sp.]|nr:transporter substrate-binding domain-containing protein [Reinekea sp.]
MIIAPVLPVLFFCANVSTLAIISLDSPPCFILIANVMRKFYVFILVLLSTSSTWAKDPSVVTVVADPWCPYNCLDSADNKGVMIDLAQAALAKSNIKLDYQNINWGRAATLVITGELDAIVGMGRSANTEKKFYFPATPLAFTQVCFYRRPGSTWVFENAESLNGQRVGWINSYKFGDDSVDAWISENRNTANVTVLSGEIELIHSLIKMLNTDRITTFGEVRNNVDYASQTLNMKVENAGCLDSIDDVYIAFSPENPNSVLLAKALDEGMRQLLETPENLRSTFQRYGLSLDEYLRNLKIFDSTQ